MSTNEKSDEVLDYLSHFIATINEVSLGATAGGGVNDEPTGGTPVEQFSFPDPVGNLQEPSAASRQPCNFIRSTPTTLSQSSNLYPSWCVPFDKVKNPSEEDRPLHGPVFGAQPVNLTPLKRQSGDLLGSLDCFDTEDDDPFSSPQAPRSRGKGPGIAHPWYDRKPPPSLKPSPPQAAFALLSTRQEGPAFKRAKTVEESIHGKNDSNADADAATVSAVSTPPTPSSDTPDASGAAGNIPIDLCDSDDEDVQEKISKKESMKKNTSADDTFAAAAAVDLTKGSENDMKQKSEWRSPSFNLPWERFRHGLMERRKNVLLRHRRSALMGKLNRNANAFGGEMGGTVSDNRIANCKEVIVDFSTEEQGLSSMTMSDLPATPSAAKETHQAPNVVEAKENPVVDMASGGDTSRSIAEPSHESKMDDPDERLADVWERSMVGFAQSESNEEEKASGTGILLHDGSEVRAEIESCLGPSTTNLEYTGRTTPPGSHPNGVTIKVVAAVPHVRVTIDDHESSVENPPSPGQRERDGTGGSNLEDAMIQFFRNGGNDDSSSKEIFSTGKCSTHNRTSLSWQDDWQDDLSNVFAGVTTMDIINAMTGEVEERGGGTILEKASTSQNSFLNGLPFEHGPVVDKSSVSACDSFVTDRDNKEIEASSGSQFVNASAVAPVVMPVKDVLNNGMQRSGSSDPTEPAKEVADYGNVSTGGEIEVEGGRFESEPEKNQDTSHGQEEIQDPEDDEIPDCLHPFAPPENDLKPKKSEEIGLSGRREEEPRESEVEFADYLSGVLSAMELVLERGSGRDAESRNDNFSHTSIPDGSKSDGIDQHEEDYPCTSNTGTSNVLPVGEIDNADSVAEDLIDVSGSKLALVLLPLVCLAGVFWMLGLVQVSGSILVGCCRTLGQLSLLGSALVPIFKWGINRPSLVCGYTIFMVVLASYEASSRTKYSFVGQWYYIFGSLLLNVSWVGLLAFGVVLKPRPLWKPQYVLPIIGMLLGNSINGISISLDAITTALVEDQAEIELYLSFGATKYEAVSRIVAHAIQRGSTPVLNMMRIVGIVHLPGMMTGQILGGTPTLVAARYQMLILFLIALCTLSSILLNSILAIETAFCPHQMLRPERFVKNQKLSVMGLVMGLWGIAFGDRTSLATESFGSGTLIRSSGRLYQGAAEPLIFPSPSSLEIGFLKEARLTFSDGESNPLLEASGLSRYFMDKISEGKSMYDAESHLRVLFQDLSFNVNEGDMLLVRGPSGTGKTQLLRILAGLSPSEEGHVKFNGVHWHDGNFSASEWRKKVRYVTQYKVQIPGTPMQFISRVTSFKSWKGDKQDDIVQNMVRRTSDYIGEWGLTADFLDKEWSTLSGGEAQRVMIALALASGSKILLFDEATSALDSSTKVLVEHSIQEYLEGYQGGVVWISHDEQQQERMAFA
jgi:putative ABC transport system permease protein